MRFVGFRKSFWETLSELSLGAAGGSGSQAGSGAVSPLTREREGQDRQAALPAPPGVGPGHRPQLYTALCRDGFLGHPEPGPQPSGPF